MPIINQIDPLSVASDAIGAYSDRKRSAALEQQARDYQKARDARSDLVADREYTLQQGEAADAHQRTLSQLQTDDQNRQIAAATEAYNTQMRPLILEQQKLANKQAAGQLVTDAENRRLIELQRQAAAIDLDIKKRYGGPAAAAALRQSLATASQAKTDAQYAPARAQAELDATRASTAATQAGTAATEQRTSQDAQFFPGQMRAQQLGYEGAQLQNTFERQQIQNNAPVNPDLERDYRSQLTSYTSRLNAYDRLSATGKLPPGTAPPVQPVSPQDFQATLADSVDHIRGAPEDLPKMLSAVDAMPGLSPYQQRTARLALQAAAKAAPPLPKTGTVPYGEQLPGGGSSAPGPFGKLLSDAAARHGVPLSIARALMGDESGGNPNAVSSRGAVGLLQLEPDAAAEVGVTDRTDPAQNINGGLAYLAKQYRRFGSWPLALAAYNAGPGNVAKMGLRALTLPNADPNYVTKILGAAGAS